MTNHEIMDENAELDKQWKALLRPMLEKGSIAGYHADEAEKIRQKYLSNCSKLHERWRLNIKNIAVS